MTNQERLDKINNYTYDGFGGNYVWFNDDGTVQMDGWFSLEILKLIVEELEEQQE